MTKISPIRLNQRVEIRFTGVSITGNIDYIPAGQEGHKINQMGENNQIQGTCPV